MEKLCEISFSRVEMDIFNPCFQGIKGLFGNPKALSSLLFYLRTLFLFFSTYYSLSSTLTNVIVKLIDTKGTIGKYSCVIHLLNLSVQCQCSSSLPTSQQPWLSKETVEPVVVAGAPVLLFHTALQLLRMNLQPGKGYQQRW